MKILVLGATGFVGTNICKKLRDDKYNFEGVDNFSFSTIDNILGGYVIYEKCVSELREKYLNEFDIIVSSYCSNIIYAANHGVETYINNVINSIKCFSKFKGKIIYLSTSSVYGNPEIIPTPESYEGKTRNPYDTSKLIVEEYLKTRGNYTTLRLTNVYGEYQRPNNIYSGVICKFTYDRLNNFKSKVFGNINDTRDYTYVGDVVDSVIKAINYEAFNTEINIGTGIETPIGDLVNKINPNFELKEGRSVDGISRRCLDISKAIKLLNWKPNTSLNEGLEIVNNWIKKEYL